MIPDPTLSTSPTAPEPMTMQPQDFRQMALQKCHEIEACPASELQTMASLVASAALCLADYGGYVQVHIEALHRAADFLVRQPEAVRDFAGYLASRFPAPDGTEWSALADEYFHDVEICGDDLDV